MKAKTSIRMTMNPTCFQCILRGFAKQMKNGRPESEEEFARRFTELAGKWGEEISAPALYYKGLHLLHEYLPDSEDDTYRPIKQAFNQAVLSMEDEIQARIEAADDPLELAIKMARAGNYLDVACVENIRHDKLAELIDRTADEQLDPRVYERFLRDLEHASSMVYFTDNAGEAVLDKLLVRTLKRLYPELRLTVIVRGGVAQADITLEDAKAIGLTEEAAVISSGIAMPGAQIIYLSEEARALAEEADLLLAKGQGNVEALCGCGLNLYYLFLCKCHIFTERFKLPQFSGCFLNEQEL